MPPETTSSDGRIVGFMDIGTNAVRLLLVRFNPNRSYTILTRQREAVRLGEGEFPEQRLQQQAMHRAVLVCARFADMARSYGAGGDRGRRHLRQPRGRKPAALPQAPPAEGAPRRARRLRQGRGAPDLPGRLQRRQPRRPARALPRHRRRQHRGRRRRSAPVPAPRHDQARRHPPDHALLPARRDRPDPAGALQPRQGLRPQHQRPRRPETAAA